MEIKKGVEYVYTRGLNICGFSSLQGDLAFVACRLGLLCLGMLQGGECWNLAPLRHITAECGSE